MRNIGPYITLLRLPYQWQLGPIFAWGFLLAGGRLHEWPDTLSFTWAFIAFHVGGFGGLTALNSAYDQDTGPIGGLWNPPSPPRHLWLFAWAVQLGGALMLFVYNIRLLIPYSLILLLSLLYSHPRTRWKAHPWKSVAVVATGQGVLDFWAGTLVAATMLGQTPRLTSSLWDNATWCGFVGTTLTIIGFYPLTQLFQLREDAQQGVFSTASALSKYFGTSSPFVWAQCFFFCGALGNASAVWLRFTLWEAILLAVAAVGWMIWIEVWRRRTQPIHHEDDDATRIHFYYSHTLLRAASLSFGVYVLARLLWH